jgi:hypothetical protein
MAFERIARIVAGIFILLSPSPTVGDHPRFVSKHFLFFTALLDPTPFQSVLSPLR